MLHNLLYLLFFAANVLGIPLVKRQDVSDNPGNDMFEKITASTAIVAVLLILIGLFLVFAGSKRFKFVMFAVGFLTFGTLQGLTLGTIAWIICASIESRNGVFGDNRTIIYSLSIVFAGLLGAALFSCLWRLGLLAVGLLMGFTLSLFILGLVDGGTIKSSVGQIIFMVLLSVLGAVLIFFFERPLLIVGTSISGSYVTFFGLDMFINTGFSSAARSFVGDYTFHDATPGMYGMIAGFVVLAIIGVFYQFKSGKHAKYTPTKAKEAAPPPMATQPAL